MKRTLLSVFAFILFSTMGTAQEKEHGTPLSYKKIPITDKWQEEPVNAVVASSPSDITFDNASTGSQISETLGELSVSLTGGATYTVPIKVPPGINGVEPTISLTYNSQGGNGLAGFGWNVSGISVITRIPPTKFHDNAINAVSFTSSDRFSFDGQRLLLKSGTYGGNGAEYQTENFSNVKIVSHGTSVYGAPYGPAYFEVIYPDGSLAHYGNTIDSRSRTDFAINYWQNPQGVRISYIYVMAGNGLSISKITYGGRWTGAAMNEIEFVYKTRSRAEQSYIGGTSFIRKNLLSDIKIKSNGSGYRNYVLGHNTNALGYNRLTSVQEKSGDNSLSYSPIVFSYSDTSNSIIPSGSTANLSVININQNNAEIVPFDIEGKGNTGFIVYPKSISERTKYCVFKDLESTTTNYAWEIPTTRFESIFPVSWLSSNNKILSGQGYAMIQNSGNQVKFKVHSDGSVYPVYFQYEKVWDAPTYSSIYNCDSGPVATKLSLDYISGDFNGDGLTDIIAISKPYTFTTCHDVRPGNFKNDDSLSNLKRKIVQINKDSLSTLNKDPENIVPPIGGDCKCNTITNYDSKIYFINLDRRITSNFAKYAGSTPSYKSTDKFLTADVNGDGRTDILRITDGKIYAYTLDSNNGLTQLWVTSSTRIKKEYAPLVGDYNGDGKTDIMYPTAKDSGLFALFLSTGTGFAPVEISYPFQYKEGNASSTIYTYNLIPVDVNGDGRTDILDYRTTTTNSNSNGTQSITAYSNAILTGTAATPAFSLLSSSSRTGNLKPYPIPIFLSADKPNNNLVFGSISDKYISTFKFNKDNRDDMLLRSLDSNGISQSITYRDLDAASQGLDGTSVYQAGANETYPLHRHSDRPWHQGRRGDLAYWQQHHNA